MILVVVNDQGRSSSNPFPLVGVGDDDMVGQVDDLIQGLLWSFPRLTHENTVNFFFNDKFVELLCFIVDAPGVDIHYSG